MSDEDKTDFGLEAIREKLKNSRGDAVVSGAAPEQDKGLKVRDDFFDASEQPAAESVGGRTSSKPFPKPSGDDGEVSWSAVSGQSLLGNAGGGTIDFTGKNLEGGKFAGENLENASFSVANLTGVDFSGCNLKEVDFSGANMSEANLSGADLTGAVLSGTVLKNANFSGAILNGVKLSEADIEGALLLDITIDELGIEELQALIEYLAKYYPHKLNLTKINLTLLDLSKIDLSKVSLRGVDFTGCNFTGVNIVGLDLSECKITPEQIAQALGRVPNAQELAKLLAPKKPQAKKLNIDLEGLFFGRGQFGVIDTTKHKGISIEQILKVGKKVFRSGAPKPPVKDSEALDHIRGEREAEVKSHNAELRAAIEARKKEMLAQMEQEKQARLSGRQENGEPQALREETAAMPRGNIAEQKPERERPAAEASAQTRTPVREESGAGDAVPSAAEEQNGREEPVLGSERQSGQELSHQLEEERKRTLIQRAAEEKAAVRKEEQQEEEEARRREQEKRQEQGGTEKEHERELEKQRLLEERKRELMQRAAEEKALAQAKEKAKERAQAERMMDARGRSRD